MKSIASVGLDVHQKTISDCLKRAEGQILAEGSLPAARQALTNWAEELRRPWRGAMEATLFTGWIYDHLRPYAEELKVGHPLMLRAIIASKKKNDRVDARKLADLLRCDLFPEGYFAQLLMNLEEVPASVIELLQMSRGPMELFQGMPRQWLEGLRQPPAPAERVTRLMSIPGVGQVTALRWAVAIGEPGRFPSVRQALSYCGLWSTHADGHKRPAKQSRLADSPLG